jgi:hypothetical protein
MSRTQKLLTSFIGVWVSLALSSFACDSPADSSRDVSGGATGHSSGGGSSTASAPVHVSSGGVNGTGGAGTTQPATGGTPSSNLTVNCSNNLDWLDPKCGGGASLCAAEPCTACELSQCANELTEMFGADWLNSTPQGPCADFLGCVRSCVCEDIACYKNCPVPSLEEDASAGTACDQAYTKLVLCTSAPSCKSVCHISGG